MSGSSFRTSPEKIRVAVDKAIAYLCRKQSDNGGFCFFRFEHLDRPNLRDTYHATSALARWGVTIPRKHAVVDFLRSEHRDDLDGLYYFLYSMRAIGVVSVEPTDLERIRDLKVPERDSNIETDRWLERLYRTLGLQVRIAGGSPHKDFGDGIEALQRRGGYGELPNLRDTCLSLRILELLGRCPQHLEATRSFVDRLQRPAVGFADMLDSQYGNLEIVVAGLECCEMLRVPLRFTHDALGFALACQSADGSFSRVPVALPDIVCTHQALEVIASLTNPTPHPLSRASSFSP